MAQQFRTNDNVVFQEVDGEIVLLDVERETYFGLNEVGTRVWQLIQRGIGVDDIVSTLQEEYDVERELLQRDVEALIDELLQAKLLQQANMSAD